MMFYPGQLCKGAGCGGALQRIEHERWLKLRIPSNLKIVKTCARLNATAPDWRGFYFCKRLIFQTRSIFWWSQSCVNHGNWQFLFSWPCYLGNSSLAAYYVRLTTSLTLNWKLKVTPCYAESSESWQRAKWLAFEGTLCIVLKKMLSIISFYCGPA